jgi:hypothetical protein
MRHHYLASVVTVLVLIAVSCSRKAGDTKAQAGVQPPPVTPDRSGWRLSWHEVAKPETPPPCDQAVCLADTVKENLPSDGWTAPYAQWLLFGSKGDAVDAYAVSSETSIAPLVSVFSYGHQQQWQDHLPGLTAPFIHFTFPRPGAYVMEVALDGADLGSAYEMRFVRATPSWLHSSPQVAALTILADSNARFSVRPSGMIDSVPEMDWAVPPGSYRLILGRDSIYTVCRIPCGEPRVITAQVGKPAILRL